MTKFKNDLKNILRKIQNEECIGYFNERFSLRLGPNFGRTCFQTSVSHWILRMSYRCPQCNETDRHATSCPVSIAHREEFARALADYQEQRDSLRSKLEAAEKRNSGLEKGAVFSRDVEASLIKERDEWFNIAQFNIKQNTDQRKIIDDQFKEIERLKALWSYDDDDTPMPETIPDAPM